MSSSPKKTPWMKLGIALALLMVCTSGVWLYLDRKPFQKSEEDYQQLALSVWGSDALPSTDNHQQSDGAAVMSTANPQATKTPVRATPTRATPSPAAPSATEAISSLYRSRMDFAPLVTINEDVVGWIYNEGTRINYPIAQGTDNSFYLEHLFNKETNPAGCIFLDVHNASDFSDANSIIYGHHLRSKRMFADLILYKQQSYYDEHPVMQLYTPTCDYNVEIFAGVVVNPNANSSPYYHMVFADDEDFETYVKRLRAQSSIETEVTVSPGDKLLTLSTCSYEFDNARYVLFGKLVALPSADVTQRRNLRELWCAVVYHEQRCYVLAELVERTELADEEPPAEEDAPPEAEPAAEAEAPGFVPAVPLYLPSSVTDNNDGTYTYSADDDTATLLVYGGAQEESPAFYAIDENGIINRSECFQIPLELTVEEDEEPSAEEDMPPETEPEAEAEAPGFMPAVPLYLPSSVTDNNDGTYTYSADDGTATLLVYGGALEESPAFYAIDENGIIDRSECFQIPLELTVEEDEEPAAFVAFTPGMPDADMIPPFYQMVDSAASIYQVQDASGNIQYRIWGAFGYEDGSAQTGFFACDANGVFMQNPPVVIDPFQDNDQLPEEAALAGQIDLLPAPSELDALTEEDAAEVLTGIASANEMLAAINALDDETASAIRLHIGDLRIEKLAELNLWAEQRRAASNIESISEGMSSVYPTVTVEEVHNDAGQLLEMLLSVQPLEGAAYQWQRGDWDGATWEDAAGETSPQLHVALTLQNLCGRYRCLTLVPVLDAGNETAETEQTAETPDVEVETEPDVFDTALIPADAYELVASEQIADVTALMVYLRANTLERMVLNQDTGRIKDVTTGRMVAYLDSYGNVRDMNTDQVIGFFDIAHQKLYMNLVD